MGKKSLALNLINCEEFLIQLEILMDYNCMKLSIQTKCILIIDLIECDELFSYSINFRSMLVPALSKLSLVYKNVNN